MSHSCENQECPICMDPIEGAKNSITTECGHAFHATCLMTSVAHNGFGCPYCRTAMAEVPEEEDDEDDEDTKLRWKVLSKLIESHISITELARRLMKDNE